MLPLDVAACTNAQFQLQICRECQRNIKDDIEASDQPRVWTSAFNVVKVKYSSLACEGYREK